MKRKILKRIGLIVCMITLLTTILVTTVGAYTELTQVPDANRYTFRWKFGMTRLDGDFGQGLELGVPTKVCHFKRPYSAAQPNYIIFGDLNNKTIFGDHTRRVIECEDFQIWVTRTNTRTDGWNADDYRIEFHCDGALVADYCLFAQDPDTGYWLLAHLYEPSENGPVEYYTYEASGFFMNLDGTTFYETASLCGLTQADFTRHCVEVRSSIQHMVMGEMPTKNFFVSFDKKYSLMYPGAESYGENQGYKEGYKEGKTDGYEDGKTDGYNQGYNQGHSDGEVYGMGLGYDVGYTEGHEDGHKAGHDAGYTDGYEVGYDEGEGVGWHNGFSKGQTDALGSTDTLKDTIFSIFEAPVTLINGFLDFEILGINLAGFVKTLITLAVTALIVTLILKFVKG